MGWPQQQDSAPPWGSSDLPPLGAGASWIKQGPEVFESDEGSNTGKIIAIVAAVVLLAGVAFGAYWIWGRGGTPKPQPSQAATAPTTAASPSAPNPLAFGNVPGAPEDHSDIKAFTDVPALNYLNSKETEAYQKATPTKAAFAVRRQNGNIAVVLLVQAASNDVAAAAAQELNRLQISNGMKAMASTNPAVLVSQVGAKDGADARIRGHYSHNGVIVRVDVTGSSATLVDDFRAALDAQLKALSADG